MEKYIDIFNKLWDHSENEVVEFKKAETNFDVDELGKYFSALSNEANLRDHEFAWIVFGVWDKKHQIIGTSFKDGEVALNRLKQDMSQHTTDNLIFRDIVPIEVEGAENGGYPPTQNGDIRSLFWLFSLMALQN